MSVTSSVTVRVPLAIRRRPGKKTVVTPMADGASTAVTRADPALVKALARAFRYQRMLDQGLYESITEMAGAERLDRGYLGRLLRLPLLAPNITDGIINGRQPHSMGLSRLMEPLPGEWGAQRASLSRCHAPASLSDRRGEQPPSGSEAPQARPSPKREIA
jgi:hypothetical protein